MEHVAVATVAGGAGPSSLPSSPPLSASSSPSLVYENGVESFESGTGPNGNAGTLLCLLFHYFVIWQASSFLDFSSIGSHHLGMTVVSTPSALL